MRQIDSSAFKKRDQVTLDGIEEFNGKEFFVEQKNGGFPFGQISENFNERIGDCVEQNVPEAVLQPLELRRFFRDPSLVEAYGGECYTARYLWYMAQLLRQQPNGEEGILLTDGNFNIFHRKVEAFYCYRRPGQNCWFVGASTKFGQCDWCCRCQVFTLVTPSVLCA